MIVLASILASCVCCCAAIAAIVWCCCLCCRKSPSAAQHNTVNMASNATDTIPLSAVGADEDGVMMHDV